MGDFIESPVCHTPTKVTEGDFGVEVQIKQWGSMPEAEAIRGHLTGKVIIATKLLTCQSGSVKLPASLASGDSH